jgi:hypothetical protein
MLIKVIMNCDNLFKKKKCFLFMENMGSEREIEKYTLIVEGVNHTLSLDIKPNKTSLKRKSGSSPNEGFLQPNTTRGTFTLDPPIENLPQTGEFEKRYLDSLNQTSTHITLRFSNVLRMHIYHESFDYFPYDRTSNVTLERRGFFRINRKESYLENVRFEG